MRMFVIFFMFCTMIPSMRSADSSITSVVNISDSLDFINFERALNNMSDLSEELFIKEDDGSLDIDKVHFIYENVVYVQNFLNDLKSLPIRNEQFLHYISGVQLKLFNAYVVLINLIMLFVYNFNKNDFLIQDSYLMLDKARKFIETLSSTRAREQLLIKIKAAQEVLDELI